MVSRLKIGKPFSSATYAYSLDECSTSFLSVDSAGPSDSDSRVSTKSTNTYSAYAVYCASDSSARRPNGEREQQYAALIGAVSRLCELPAYDKLHVAEAACVRVGEVLGLLSSQTDVVPPKLFPQDEETLALTWTKGRFIRMLSVDESDLSMVDIDKKSQNRCLHEIADSDNLQALLPALGLFPRVSTAS